MKLCNDCYDQMASNYSEAAILFNKKRVAARDRDQKAIAQWLITLQSTASP